MRIAILGKWHKYSSYFLHGCLEGSIQNGHSAMGIEFIDCDLDVTRSALMHYRPNLIFCHMLLSDAGSSIKDKLEMLSDIKAKHGCKTFYQLGDPRTLPRYDGDISKAVDYALIAHREWDKFSHWKVPIIYFPYGCLKQDCIIEREMKYRLVFAGTHESKNPLYEDRTKFLNQLKSKHMIALFPRKNEYNTTFITAKLSASAGAVLNILGRHDIKDFLSLRPFQFIGAGAFSIQKRLNGLDEVFIDKKHHICFDNYDIEEIENILKYYLDDHPEERNKIRKEGFDFCQKNHNYKNRIQDLLEIIEGKRTEVRYKIEDFK